MGVTLGGQQCRDPFELYESCLRADPPIPTGAFWGRANSFRCPLGKEPGRGYVVMNQAELKKLGGGAGNLNQAFTLKFRDASNNQLPIPNLFIEHAEAISPSFLADGSMPYLLTLVDERRALAMAPTAKAYNLLCSPAGNYLSQTLNSGVAWTWAAMASSLWSQALAPAFPGLPFAPDGTPGPFNYQRSDSWTALNDFLQRLACALRFDPITGAVSIVRLGVVPAGNAAIIKKLVAAHAKVWDDFEKEPVVARLPQFVRVMWREQPRPLDGTNEWYFLDKTDTTKGNAGFFANTYVVVEDDLPALMPVGGGTPTNLAALTSRSTERAADYYRKAELFNARQRMIFAGIQPAAVPLLGGQFVEIIFEETGGGFFTSVVARPDANSPAAELLANWKAYSEFGPYQDAGGLFAAGCCVGAPQIPGYIAGVQEFLSLDVNGCWRLMPIASCPTSGSGSGGGGGAPIQTPCCANAIPRTLLLTGTDGSSDTLTWTGGFTWQGSITVLCGGSPTAKYELSCNNPNWNLVKNNAGSPSCTNDTIANGTGTCNSFSFNFVDSTNGVTYTVAA